jgi:hypothetical protein
MNFISGMLGGGHKHGHRSTNPLDLNGDGKVIKLCIAYIGINFI